MSFTSKSEKLIKYFVKDFDNYCEKKVKLFKIERIQY